MGKSFETGAWTSEVAKEMSEAFAPRVKAEILSYLQKQKQLGATDQELEMALGRPGNTIRPSRVGLVKSGIVVPTEKWRHTIAKRPAIVWVLACYAGDAE